MCCRLYCIAVGVCAVDYTAARVDAALFPAVALDAVFILRSGWMRSFLLPLVWTLTLYTAVSVYVAYILRLGWVLSFSIDVGVVATPFLLIIGMGAANFTAVGVCAVLYTTAAVDAAPYTAVGMDVALTF